MSQRLRQIPLDLTFRPSYGRDSLVVAPCNEDAVRWIDRWPDWGGYPVLTICGPAASGKHHLASLWAQRSDAKFLSPDEFCKSSFDNISQAYKNIVIERTDYLIGDKDEEEKLFHLYNHAQQNKLSIVLTMQNHPSNLSYAHGGHLSSRLQASPVAQITAPDDQTLAAVMVKLCADRHMDIAPDMVFYALDRMERSFAAIKNLVETLDKTALADKRKITLPLLRQVMMTVLNPST